VQHFESDEFFFFCGKGSKHNRTGFTARKIYDVLIDTCEDEELWNSEQPIVPSYFTTDIIVHADGLVSPEDRAMEALCERRWKLSDDIYRWGTCERVNDPPPPHDPIIVISPPYEYISYRFPATGGGMKEEDITYVAQKYEEIFHYLQSTFGGCGWFTGTPRIEIVNFAVQEHEPNQLCEPGTEHEYALPVDNKQVTEWILDGSVVAGKILLIHCRSDLDKELKEPYCCSSVNYFNHEELYQSNAEILVFYCNNSSTNSPRAIKQYHAWLRENHPDSKQRCLLLSNGINGLFGYVKNNYPPQVLEGIFKECRSIFW
jgi:hypothetical protein